MWFFSFLFYFFSPINILLMVPAKCGLIIDIYQENTGHSAIVLIEKGVSQNGKKKYYESSFRTTLTEIHLRG